MLRARLNQLPEGPRRLVQTAAVLGSTFSERLLQASWPDADTLEAWLLELGQRALCYVQSGVEERVYAFKHTLIQEVAYDSILPMHRPMLHTAVSQALHVLYADHLEDVSDLLAHHDARTEQAGKAVASLTRLAKVAADKGGHAEAVAALRETLVHVEHLPRDQQIPYRLDLILRQAECLVALGHYQETATLLTQHREHFDQPQDTWRGSRHALLLAQTYSSLGEWEAAAQHAQHVFELAAQCQDETTMGQACYVLARERYRSGRLIEGVEFSQRAVSLLQQPEARSQLGMAYLVLGLHTLLIGDFASALRAAEQTRSMGTALGDPQLLSFADWLTGWAQATCGRWEEGTEACQRSLEQAPDPLSAALSLGWLGYAYLEQGDAAEAIPLLQQSVQRMRQFHQRRLEGLYTIFLSEAYRLRDELDTAHDLTQQGLSVAQETAYRTGVAWAQRTLGRISRAADALVAAERHFREALSTFDALQVRFEAGRTHLDLADLTHLQGNHQATMMHLTAAYNLFTELHVPIYAERAQQRAHELGCSPFLGTCW